MTKSIDREAVRALGTLERRVRESTCCEAAVSVGQGHTRGSRERSRKVMTGFPREGRVSRLVPYSSYCKQCCKEQWDTCVSFNFGFFRVYA